MRLSTAASGLAALMALNDFAVSGFKVLVPKVLSLRFEILEPTKSSLFSSSEEGSVCAIPDNVSIPDSVTAQSLRSAVLTDVNGKQIKLGDKMGKGTSVVIFLRHLG
mmetsp:Transcript_32757/g.49374  ORF Transcript_32757/g.49374 Transcript_32757/m.49374 type:complete len:107 (-) Transcript_32757:834-1154(-)